MAERPEKHFFLRLCESLDVPLFFLDQEGRVEYLNPAGAQLFVGQTAPGAMPDLQARLLPTELQRDIQPLTELDQVLLLDKELDTLQGRRTFEIRCHPLPDEKGGVAGTVVMLHDITALTQVNKELAQTNDLLYEASQALQQHRLELADTYEQLKMSQSTLLQQEKMASIGQLAAGVAHEINNPMGYICSNLNTMSKYIQRLSDCLACQQQLLQETARQEQLKDLAQKKRRWKIDYILQDGPALIEESQEGAERVRQIVSSLKGFARQDQPRQMEVDINECLESTLRVVWNEIKYKAKVERCYGELPLLLCYPQQLNQVFMNLMVNAAQSFVQEGTITLTSTCDGSHIYVGVADTGCGIEPEQISRLFEPFYTTKEVGKGTGLGLSIAYDIIRKHGGQILVESKLGVGSLFTVKLPCHGLEERREEE